MKAVHFVSGGELVTIDTPTAELATAAPRRIPRLDPATPTGSAAPRAARRDATENRQRVVATARELFTEQGVAAVSMHDVARTAGIGQGTLYRHFPNKGALCEALIYDNLRQFHDDAVGRLEGDADDLGALGQLRWFLDALLAFTEENGPLASAMGDSACGVTPEEHYQSSWAVWQRGTIAALLERAIARAEIAPVDVDATVDVIAAACNPSLYLDQRHRRGYSRERVVSTLIRLLTGLAGGSPATPT
jgi:AcrR family transcriptional regulator